MFRSLGRGFLVALFGAILAVGLLLALVVAPVVRDPKQRAIERKRAENYSRALLNLPLPQTPDLANLDARLAAFGASVGSPVLIRIFKREFELELWLARDGRYHHFATYPICRWSGRLGPKFATGDKQAPEGFYTVAADQMNPNSRWHRSFNLGFPNAFDASYGRTGSALMVHGGCSSVGCYAMTNAVIDEIWKLTTAAHGRGQQKRFQVQAYPFRMTPEALAAEADSPHGTFWHTLKVGYDLFEATGLPPVATVCRGSYRFSPGNSLTNLSTLTRDCGRGVLLSGSRGKKAL